MLLKAEFDENMSNLERSVDDMLSGGEGKKCFASIFGCNFIMIIPSLCNSLMILCIFFVSEMMSSQKLQDLFYMVLMAGNFLNSVSKIFYPFELAMKIWGTEN